MSRCSGNTPPSRPHHQAQREHPAKFGSENAGSLSPPTDRAQCVIVMLSRGICLVLLVTTIVAGCGDGRESATGEIAVTMTSVGPSGASTEQRSSVAVTDADPTLSAEVGSAEVLAAAVRYRVETYASGHYTTLFIIDRLGRYSEDDGYITDWADGQELTAFERAAIAAALEPRSVSWIAHWRDVMGDPPSPTLPDERQAIILLAEPSIDGSRADVATELSCGTTCSYGATTLLERSSDGDWQVTGETDAFVS